MFANNEQDNAITRRLKIRFDWLYFGQNQLSAMESLKIHGILLSYIRYMHAVDFENKSAHHMSGNLRRMLKCVNFNISMVNMEL